MEKAERVATLKKNISTLTRVLEEVEGRRGTCRGRPPNQSAHDFSS